MDVKTLAIDQTAVAKAEIGLVKGFIANLNSATSLQKDEVLASLARLDQAETLLLKSVDQTLSYFLSLCMAPLKDADQSQRALFVKDLEHMFQIQRETVAGQTLLDLILTPLLSHIVPREIWIPGCGEGYEAAWIEQKFHGTIQHYLDIDTEALAKLRKRLHSLKSTAVISEVDLTKSAGLPTGQPDLVLFFNPFVIENADYQRLVVTLSDKKLSDSKADAFLRSLSMSAQSQLIFDNILSRMATNKYFVSVTMDLAEAHVIFKYFESRKSRVTCYKNPYAIKNLASHLLGKRNPRVEPKIYQYIILAEA